MISDGLGGVSPLSWLLVLCEDFVEVKLTPPDKDDSLSGTELFDGSVIVITVDVESIVTVVSAVGADVMAALPVLDTRVPLMLMELTNVGEGRREPPEPG